MKVKTLGMAALALLLSTALTTCKKKKKGGGDKPTQDEMAAMDPEPMKPEPMKPEPDKPKPVVKKLIKDAKAVVDKAIKAHGGLKELKAKLSKFTAESQGQFHGMPYKSTVWYMAPDSWVMDIHGMMKMGIVGKACWGTHYGVVRDCHPKEAEAQREQVQTSYLSLIYPLKDEGAKIDPGEIVKVEGKEAHGIVVTLKGMKKPAKMFFDKDSGLFVRLEWKGLWSGRLGLLRYDITSHMKVGKIQMPKGSKTYFNGKLIMTEEVTKVQLNKLDAKMLKKPPQVKFGKAAIRKMQPQVLAYTTHKGDWNKLGPVIGKLVKWILSKKYSPMGPPVLVFVKDAKDPKDAVTEVQMPVAPNAKEGKDGAFGVKKMAAMEAACAAEQGPYKEVGKKFEKLLKWMKKKKLKPGTPPAMIGLSDPTRTKPDKLISVLCFGVKK